MNENTREAPIRFSSTRSWVLDCIPSSINITLCNKSFIEIEKKNRIMNITRRKSDNYCTFLCIGELVSIERLPSSIQTPPSYPKSIKAPPKVKSRSKQVVKHELQDKLCFPLLHDEDYTKSTSIVSVPTLKPRIGKISSKRNPYECSRIKFKEQTTVPVPNFPHLPDLMIESSKKEEEEAMHKEEDECH